MKPPLVPLALFLLLSLLFIADLYRAAAELPEHVATHFDAAGRPNGWMTRSGDITFTACLGFGLSFTILGIMYCTRFLPAPLINIPRRDYWLAPERRAIVDAFLFRHALWFGCLALGFADGLHRQIVAANRPDTPQLDAQGTLLIAGLFIGGVLVWSIVLIVRFTRKS